MNTRIMGVDVGGVIIDRQNDQTDTSFFGPSYLETTPVPGVFEALNELRKGGYLIHVVSKCGANTQRRTLKWLKHHNFYQRTGTLPENLHFCRTRPEKAPICRRLGATHFVDDRLDVLDYLNDVPNLFLFQPNPSDEQRFQASPQRARLVWKWEEVLAGLDCFKSLIQAGTDKSQSWARPKS